MTISKVLANHSKNIFKSGGFHIGYGLGRASVFMQASASFTCTLQGTGNVKFIWGDGTTNTYTLSSTDLVITKTFANANTRNIYLQNSDYVTKFVSVDGSGGSTFTFNAKDFPNCTDLELANSIIKFKLSDIPQIKKLIISSTNNNVIGGFSDIVNCEYLYCASRNIYGSLNPLTKLTYLSLPNATLAGVVSGNLDLLNQCLLFNITPTNNVVTANMVNFNSGIQFINILGTSNVLTFGNFNVSNLCFYATPSVILTNSQQNYILQGIWDSRDNPRQRTNRSINLSGAVGTPTLDATGLALKALLQAYTTPNSDGSAATVWTITHR